MYKYKHLNCGMHVEDCGIDLSTGISLAPEIFKYQFNVYVCMCVMV